MNPRQVMNPLKIYLLVFELGLGTFLVYGKVIHSTGLDGGYQPDPGARRA